jgi:hypothetical protein
MLRSSNWFRTFPFHGKAYGFESRTEYCNYAGYGSGLSARSHKPGIGGSNPSPAHFNICIKLRPSVFLFFLGLKTKKDVFQRERDHGGSFTSRKRVMVCD